MVLNKELFILIFGTRFCLNSSVVLKFKENYAPKVT